ncbi:NfeD family protein [Roseomonas sp. CECT 9278]|uniref:NfeD family protein n=1 Tax=Roseomonas sp. CECT 9278 TaxID=2845823 RepID=UPI001E2CC045|nr:NfeD family protein [Roseomonas sp. CECT 9278]CAH0208263.1 Inner membrane protein YbbJ [Roseomonas sp. CECT 9278]
MDPALIWILAGLVLLGAETILPGVFLLWVGIAALGTGLLLFAVAPPFWVTTACFVILLAAGIAVALRLRRSQHPRPRVNTPDAGLIGRFGVLTDPGAAGPRVRVGDSDWAARLPRDVAESPAGTRVRVEGVDGTTLVVRPE